MTIDRHHVSRTRTRDTSVSMQQMNRPATPGIGSVRYSKEFASRAEAQREADAWNGEGDYAKHGPTDWHATVVPGRAPRVKDR